MTVRILSWYDASFPTCSCCNTSKRCSRVLSLANCSNLELNAVALVPSSCCCPSGINCDEASDEAVFLLLLLLLLLTAASRTNPTLGSRCCCLAEKGVVVVVVVVCHAEHPTSNRSGNNSTAVQPRIVLLDLVPMVRRLATNLVICAGECLSWIQRQIEATGSSKYYYNTRKLPYLLLVSVTEKIICNTVLVAGRRSLE